VVEALRKAILAQDKAKLDTLTAEQLSYSHSDARLEDKAKFIDSIMTRKAVIESIDFSDLTVAIVGNNAIVRHLWVSESELDGKVTNTKIGVLQVWQKQDSGWKLLARASFRLPQPPERSWRGNRQAPCGRSYYARLRGSGVAEMLRGRPGFPPIPTALALMFAKPTLMSLA
jgi:hypothetical protein